MTAPALKKRIGQAQRRASIGEPTVKYFSPSRKSSTQLYRLLDSKGKWFTVSTTCEGSCFINQSQGCGVSGCDVEEGNCTDGTCASNCMAALLFLKSLGADTGRLRRQRMLRTALLLAASFLLALGLCFTLQGFVAPQLHQVSALDPRLILAALAVLLVTSLLASYLPLYRLREIDPAQVLKNE